MLKYRKTDTRGLSEDADRLDLVNSCSNTIAYFRKGQQYQKNRKGVYWIRSKHNKALLVVFFLTVKPLH